MIHKCGNEVIVYIDYDTELSDEINSLIKTVNTSGYDGKGYYLITSEEYISKINYCPICGMELVS